jgi:hypothetical protein
VDGDEHGRLVGACLHAGDRRGVGVFDEVTAGLLLRGGGHEAHVAGGPQVGLVDRLRTGDGGGVGERGQRPSITEGAPQVEAEAAEDEHHEAEAEQPQGDAARLRRREAATRRRGGGTALRGRTAAAPARRGAGHGTLR